MRVEKREELTRLFDECVNTYLTGSEGRGHLSNFPRVKRQGRENFEAVLAAAKRNEDITDMVLLKWLPHTDSPVHRDQGAWVHVAPAITGELKRWFQANGWVRADAWPNVAKLIFRFVTRCAHDVEGLVLACDEFASDPNSKGLQTGMLTPILNAIDEQRFLVINNKTRKTLNYFLDAKYKQALSDFPAANEAALQFSRKEIGPLARRHAFLSAASDGDLFDIFSHWLVGVKRFFGGIGDDDEQRQASYWKIAPGDGAWQWDDCRKNGFIALGWDKFGDLTGLSREEFERRRRASLRRFPEWSSKGLEQLWKFAHIQKGDRIVANRGTSQVLGIGTVTGTYYYKAGVSMAHRLPVRWDDTIERQVTENGWRRTLIRLNREKFKRIVALAGRTATDRAFSEPEPAATAIAESPAARYGIDDALMDLFIEKPKFEEMLGLLELKKNIILQGPPGVGKSFFAKRLAYALLGERDEGRIGMVQFHPTYSYEDFIQGYRPNGSGFSRKNGIFYSFCETARSDKERKHVFIIDEINRANLSKVFGELMMLFEADKRGPRWAIPLTYAERSEETFYVPENVFLIGLMNTADRSLAMVDYALRRRFAFVDIEPGFRTAAFREFLLRYGATEALVEKIVERLTAVNKRIENDTANLGAGYCIGHSFFCAVSEDVELDEKWYERIVRTEIRPLLREYWFDDRSKADALVDDLLLAN